MAEPRLRAFEAGGRVVDDPIAPEVADATLAARQGDWGPSVALLAVTGQSWDRRWRRLAALARGTAEDVNHYKTDVVTAGGACA